MAYTKITIEVVVDENDSEILEQELNNAMDKIEERVTVYTSAVTTAATEEPENTAYIVA